MTRVVITGGIGSGKSVVSHIVAVMGIPVYDCDSEAIRLLHVDDSLRRDVIALLGLEAYDRQGGYDRRWVGNRVFAQPQLLEQLNALVHPAVARDIGRWASEQESDLVMIETALMRQSGLNKMADAIWRVVAPDEVRVARVRQRSGLTAHQVQERIEAQRRKESPFDGEVILVNDGVKALLPQVFNALEQLRSQLAP